MPGEPGGTGGGTPEWLVYVLSALGAVASAGFGWALTLLKRRDANRGKDAKTKTAEVNWILTQQQRMIEDLRTQLTFQGERFAAAERAFDEMLAAERVLRIQAEVKVAQLTERLAHLERVVAGRDSGEGKLV